MGKGGRVAALSSQHRAFGKAVRALREARGMTQDTLASRCKLSENYVGDTERGERNVSIRVLWQLADGLRVDAASIMHETEKQLRANRKR